MKTEILTDLKRAADLLKQGEIVAFPTETVYGLAAPIFNPESIQKIYAAKGRPSDNPLIAHISDLAQVPQIAVNIPKAFDLLASHFFPGPLTVVLERHRNVPASVSAGLSTIALRMPAHPLARELISRVGEPLVAPSANLSGRPSSTEPKHVLEDFDGIIAAVVDGGACSVGIESTVLSLLDPLKPAILRPGSVTREMLEELLQMPVIFGSGQVVSPGMKYRHYAPKAPMRLFMQWKEMLDYLNLSKAPNRLLLTNQRVDSEICHTLSPSSLYRDLRLADEENYAEILVYCDQALQNNPAMMNRLTKAAGVTP